MKTLSKFLAEHIICPDNYDDEEYADIIQYYARGIHEGIIAYQKHLKNDKTKTVQWAMIESQIIVALTRCEKGDT